MICLSLAGSPVWAEVYIFECSTKYKPGQNVQIIVWPKKSNKCCEIPPCIFWPKIMQFYSVFMGKTKNFPGKSSLRRRLWSQPPLGLMYQYQELNSTDSEGQKFNFALIYTIKWHSTRHSPRLCQITWITPRTAICVQILNDSLNCAIRITYRI